ncbi:MAG: tRNA adenosine(34) deaminase TadA [Comamonas sp.]|nr:tRNA adenosine(34) deaminase TadA [Comamonas sp.]
MHTNPNTSIDIATDSAWMRHALTLAAQAAAAGEVPVGAVVVKDGQLLGQGYNAPIALHDPSAHAEIQALRQAAQALGNYRLEGCTLYVTLEPCTMCSGALLAARLARVVYGAPEPKTGAAGSVHNVFALPQLNAHTQVQGGVLAQECSALLQAFFQQRRQQQRQQAQPLRQDALRTPPARFADFPLSAPSHYVADLPPLAGLRLHYQYLQAAPEQANATPPFTSPATWLLLHGPQGWCWQMQDLLLALHAQGQSVLTVDLPGWGMSDKPKKPATHQPAWHGQVLQALCQHLGLGEQHALVLAADDALWLAALAPSLPNLQALCWLPAGLEQAGQQGQLKAAQAAPFPDAGHRAGPKTAAKWSTPPLAQSPLPLLDLHARAQPPQALAMQAVEYFAALQLPYLPPT